MHDANTCLFVGRWQPFHAGHQALIRTALDDGMDVAVGIRDTDGRTGDAATENPYTLVERWDMIVKWWDEVRGKYPGRHLVCFKLPDISEIRYGRDVGYKVTEIKLTPELESITASGIRTTRGIHVPTTRPWFCGRCGEWHPWDHVCQLELPLDQEHIPSEREDT